MGSYLASVIKPKFPFFPVANLWEPKIGNREVGCPNRSQKAWSIYLPLRLGIDKNIYSLLFYIETSQDFDYVKYQINIYFEITLALSFPLKCKVGYTVELHHSQILNRLKPNTAIELFLILSWCAVRRERVEATKAGCQSKHIPKPLNFSSPSPFHSTFLVRWA